jgi:hypothetical protein
MGICACTILHSSIQQETKPTYDLEPVPHDYCYLRFTFCYKLTSLPPTNTKIRLLGLISIKETQGVVALA